jgi:hypothetical protein
VPLTTPVISVGDVLVCQGREVPGHVAGQRLQKGHDGSPIVVAEATAELDVGHDLQGLVAIGHGAVVLVPAPTFPL